MISRNCQLFRKTICCNLVINLVRNKGHSKWDNIRHTKATKDTQKSKVISRWITQITQAVYSGGGSTSVVGNGKLAEVISRAKKESVPITTIERTLKRLSNKEATLYSVEVLGPGGVFVLIDTFTENRNFTKTNIKSILSKYKGTTLARPGAFATLFGERGVVRIGKVDKENKEISLEDAEGIAIEAGAEEIENEDDSGTDDEDAWTFICDKEEVYYVKDHIEKRFSNVEIKEFGTEKYPLKCVDPNDNDLEELAKLNEDLLDLPEVHKVYINVK